MKWNQVLLMSVSPCILTLNSCCLGPWKRWYCLSQKLSDWSAVLWKNHTPWVLPQVEGLRRQMVAAASTGLLFSCSAPQWSNSLRGRGEEREAGEWHAKEVVTRGWGCTPACFVNRRMGSKPLPLCSVAHAELNNSFLVLINKRRSWCASLPSRLSPSHRSWWIRTAAQLRFLLFSNYFIKCSPWLGGKVKWLCFLLITALLNRVLLSISYLFFTAFHWLTLRKFEPSYNSKSNSLTQLLIPGACKIFEIQFNFKPLFPHTGHHPQPLPEPSLSLPLLSS